MSNSTDVKEIGIVASNYIILYFAFLNDSITVSSNSTLKNVQVSNSNTGTRCSYSTPILKITRAAVITTKQVECEEMEKLC